MDNPQNLRPITLIRFGSTKEKYWLYHGIVMWFVYNCLMLVQIITNRYLKHKWKLSMTLHRTSALAMLVFTALGFYFMFAFLGNKIDIEKHGVIHVVLGFSTMSALVVNIGLGIRAYYHRTNTKSNWNTTAVIRKAKRLHRNVAIYMVASTQVGIVAGLLFRKFNGFGTKVIFWVLLQLTFFFGSLAVCEFIYRREAKKTDPFIKPSCFLTSDEFDERI